MKFGFFAILFFLTVSATAFATSQTNAPVPKLKVENDENGPISDKVANDMYESCLYHIPSRFTPKAREYYCSCNAAQTQLNFKFKEYAQLQKLTPKDGKNKLYEKYISVAVAPCVADLPVQQIEYLDCMLDMAMDVRVANVPRYCSCVSRKIRDHAKKYALPEIMTRLIEYPQGFRDPVDALWDNNKYMTATANAKDDCIINGEQYP